MFPTNGFNKNGKGLLSGKGSTEITAAPPDKLVGKVNPVGAFIIKSSPGNGGTPPVPENGDEASAPLDDVNTPVLTGLPLINAQPSYFQPVGKAGKFKPAVGEPVVKLINQRPLNSSVVAGVEGVAKTYFPAAVKKVVFNAAECPIDNDALAAEKSPAKICCALGAGSVSGNGSIVRTNAVAFAKSDLFTSKLVFDNCPDAFTVKTPVETGFPPVIIHPSYLAVAPKSSSPVIFNVRSFVLLISFLQEEKASAITNETENSLI